MATFLPVSILVLLSAVGAAVTVKLNPHAEAFYPRAADQGVERRPADSVVCSLPSLQAAFYSVPASSDAPAVKSRAPVMEHSTVWAPSTPLGAQEDSSYASPKDIYYDQDLDVIGIVSDVIQNLMTFGHASSSSASGSDEPPLTATDDTGLPGHGRDPPDNQDRADEAYADSREDDASTAAKELSRSPFVEAFDEAASEDGNDTGYHRKRWQQRAQRKLAEEKAARAEPMTLSKLNRMGHKGTVSRRWSTGSTSGKKPKGSKGQKRHGSR